MKLWLCDTCAKNMNKGRTVWKLAAGRFSTAQKGQCANCEKMTKVKSYDDSQGE
jgi:hypothetical protein